MVRAWAIARIELLRLFRDRSNIFFVFVFPLLLVALIGAQFGGTSEQRIGFVAPDGDAEAAALAAALDATSGVVTVPVVDAAELEDEVARGSLVAGVVVPEGFADSVAAAQHVSLRFVGRPDTTSLSLRSIVEGVVAERAAPGTAAASAAAVTGGDPAALLGVARAVAGDAGDIEVVTTTLGEDALAREFAGAGQFDIGASSQLFLFTFLTSMTGGIALIQTRQWGVAHRILSTPTAVRWFVVGQAGGRWLVALTQAGYIVLATLLFFRVDWGDPLASGAVIVLFSIVAAAAGLVVGATLRNESQASGVGVGLGLGLAALGGSMVPIELFPPTIRTIAHVTPHAWANEAMAEIVRRDAGITGVLPQLGALAAFAVVLLALGVWSLQRNLTGAATGSTGGA